ncbi:helicase-exonuclease AddAB subunit AddB [Bacillus sp. V33-4]|uniref:helicase-exonuclease AddAB subunit AddB n=1 Tax=Bacillus sp. V33-4 TaxID=2054169 RepID=UPI000C7952E0|nr:helicase-exonuclease AddAB subunit AddB [Bacillus sp. V33-4]PLR87365.1 helicase-exonuclease AddAB subunit AddB [Bacillus sp. V33-4]
MSVRLLIGRSGSGKTETCLNEIRERLFQEPDGDPIIYLVPEQMTFLSEYRLVTTPDLGGMIRAQVYSFTRLAWRVLQETGGISRYHLNSIGISMLIRKIIEENKDELTIFQRAADKNGFIQQMEQMLTEFKRYCINPEELAEKHAALAENEQQKRIDIQDKLHDLELIYNHFDEAMAGKYTDSEDYFRLFTEQAASSGYLKNAEVYIDGFYSFTPQEYLVIQQLMKHCKRVTITLTLDQPFHETAPDELHLFRMSGETCQTLYEIVKAGNIELEPEFILNEQKRWEHPSLNHLEAHFDTRPAQAFQGAAAVTIVQAANRRAELEGVAREIKHLVRDKDYRFKDIAVLTRNGSDYHEIIETIFHDYGIPYFIDQKRTMLHHPLLELIRSSLEVIVGNWRYEPVFRAVKTELLYPLTSNPAQLREQMDRLENYVLAYGIQGDKWTKRERWVYRRIRGLENEAIAQTDAEKRAEQELNELRLLITAPILRMSRRLKRAENGRDLSEAVYLFVEELDIPAKLEQWKLAAEEQGNLVRAREHDQAWDAIIAMLDQFVEMLGQEKVPLKQFASILDAGMEALKFSLVPPAIDQVLAADLERSRLSDIKAAFVIGLNEGVLPAKINEEGILADEDREALLAGGLKIAASSKTKLLDENFLAYKAFITPSKQLYLSYPLANEEGKALMPSPYIKRIVDLLPEARHDYFVVDPSELPEMGQLEFVSGETTALSYLAGQMQLKKRNYPIYDFWWDVYNYYMKSSEQKKTAYKVLSSLFYENKARQLSRNVSSGLYGDHIQASVSRMEMFNSCPFSHFAQHGLKLRDRKIFRLEAPDIGDLFHAALKHISEAVNARNLSWSSMTRADCEMLAKEAVEKLAPKLQNEILLSSNRHFYIKRKLENIISRASYILSEHSKASGFVPIGLELGFGLKEQLPPLSFSLKNGAKMELAGRIDRVDKAENEDGVYLRVVDYKSSERDLNLSEVYYGLSLQMLTYLDIVISHAGSLIGTEASPAGVLYFHVHNPIIQTSKMLSLDEIEREIFKKFKMNGLLLGDENVLNLMDRSLDSGESLIVPAGIKKDGTLSKRSKVASSAEFARLTNHVRNIYEKTGNEITEGITDVSPYKLKNKIPCTFCSFKSVCQFDQSVEGNNYRILNPKQKDDVLEIIRGEDEGIDESPNSGEA